jgi:hypothetical protein
MALLSNFTDWFRRITLEQDHDKLVPVEGRHFSPAIIGNDIVPANGGAELINFQAKSH